MIKHIRIKNFKSLRDVSVDLEPITVLIGRGGTGKSNFVNAIAFLRDCLQMKDAAVQQWGGGRKLICALATPRDARNGPELQFEVRFEVPGQDGDFIYHLGLDTFTGNPDHIAIGKESLEHLRRPVFARENNHWVTQPAMSPVPNPSPITLELASGIPEVGLSYVILTAGIGCYDFSGDVLQSQSKRQKNRQPNQLDAGLADDAGNFLECFEAINRNLQNVSAQQEIIAALRKLKPTLRGVRIAVPERNHVIVSLGFEKRDFVFDLSQESEGFRRFLAHLIALYQVPAKSLVIFEEPEKGMYPGALSALADQIKAYPAMSEGGQVILTTHSPVLLDYFEPEQIRVVEMENLETKIGPISQPQMEALREQLETTGELLTVDPAQIASPAPA